MRKRIGECLIQAGLVTDEDLQIALGEHKRSGERIGAVLVRLNFATEKQVAKALAFQLGSPYTNLAEEPPDPEAMPLIPKEVALARGCVAVRIDGRLLTVATAEPLLLSALQDLEARTGHHIKQTIALRSEILASIENGYVASAHARREAANRPATSGSSGERRDSSGVGDLVDLIVNGAISSGASDVHIEPRPKAVVVRHRLDGLLKEVLDLPKRVQDGLVAGLKAMAGMDVGEKRRPQQGRLHLDDRAGRAVDLVVSTLPTVDGEKVVVRLLDRRREALALEELGLAPAALEIVRQLLAQPHGMILAAGPAASGRTTTLSAAAGSVASGHRSVITIEDPVEYEIPRASQTQLDEKGTMTFAAALTACLRQDPDVVLVGELRDRETAAIAIEAARSGQLVLSSFHSSDAPSTVAALADIGLQPYLTASALIGVIGQRLVRRLCASCRRQYTPDADTLRALNIAETDAAQLAFYRAVGCEHCSNTGYRGRIAVCEVLPVTDRIRRLISQNADEATIRETAIAGGMITLDEDGRSKLKAGLTTAEELLRVVARVRGSRADADCRKCGRALHGDWSFCPYCATAQARPDRRRRREQATELPLSNVAEFKNPAR